MWRVQRGLIRQSAAVVAKCGSGGQEMLNVDSHVTNYCSPDVYSLFLSHELYPLEDPPSVSNVVVDSRRRYVVKCKVLVLRIWYLPEPISNRYELNGTSEAYGKRLRGLSSPGFQMSAFSDPVFWPPYQHDKFHDIIDSFENIKPSENIEETLQLEILKLRLCRWRDAIVQLAGASETPEGADASLFDSFLSFIQNTLGLGAEMPLSAGLTNAEDHWLIQTLQDAAGAHRGPSHQTSSTEGRPKRAISRPTLMAVKGLVDQLEVAGLQKKLHQLRSADSEAFKKHHRACEQDINLLKGSAMAVDPKFGELLRWGGDLFSDIEVQDNFVGHFGHNLAPGESSAGATFTGIKAGGHAFAHFGHTIGNFKGKTMYDGRQEADK
ncbi:uncharacterized protein BDR25DRAFT_343192 [Lindgomyces ingoldianus]|uniref:Uncharacterized protein n=1 Tax=Lindgomyces ingoldianus TaxID=673940 RepID=A0ACB6QUA8_9PLEO|nr:uncharacterized protein BDR25DRAFT_343192 [Lindgomyces ingoldianus]KAF2470475.1 hypothetical protein BDR25DRAFT_343192 [Lindgomyces ingoldianus]